MQFKIDQKTLNEQIALVSRAVPSKASHPVLTNILFVASDGVVSLTGFDLSLGIRTQFDADVITEGLIALPAKLLADIVGKLEGEISIAVGDDVVLDEKTEINRHIVTLKTDGGKFQISGMDASEFPNLTTIESEPITLPSIALQEGMRAVFAAATDETKQILCGVRITQSVDEIEFAATDGHRLVVITTTVEDLPKVEKPIAVTIPSRSLSELSRVITASGADEIVLKFDEATAIFEAGDYVLTSQVLDGAYPAYNQLIPKSFTGRATIDRLSLVKALETVGVLTSEKNSLVQFDFSDLGINIIATSLDGSASRFVTAGLSGLDEYAEKDKLIGFNYKYLISGLKEFRVKDARMNFNNPVQPVIFDFSDGRSKAVYLVMPVQVRQ